MDVFEANTIHIWYDIWFMPLMPLACISLSMGLALKNFLKSADIGSIFTYVMHGVSSDTLLIHLSFATPFLPTTPCCLQAQKFSPTLLRFQKKTLRNRTCSDL